MRRCLEKRPEERFQSAHDAAFALEAVASGSNSGRLAVPDAGVSARRVPWWTVAIAVPVALGLGLFSGYQLEHPPTTDTSNAAVRFMLDANRGVVPEVSISPDGRYLAWTALANGGQSGGLWVRKLDASEPDLLRDTPSSGTAFWSSDGREVVVQNGSRLTAVDVERGNRRILLDLEDEGLPIRGGDWIGQRLLLSSAGAIWLVEVTNVASRTRLTTPDAQRELWHGWPMFLEDGRRFVYTAALTSGAMETRIGTVDGGEAVRVALPNNVTRVRYDTRGYLVFGQNGAWREPGVDEVQFEWVDRAGRTLQSVSDADSYTNFDLSPDGSFIATTRRRGEGGSVLFLIDTRRNIATPISDRNNAAPISDPTWSPDGRQLVYRRGNSMVLRNAFGGEERTIGEGAGYPDSWGRDGRFLIVGRPHGPAYQLWAVAMNGTTEDIPLVTGLALADEPRFSPDGRWVIFHASVQAGPEVYAIAFPPTGERWQISSGGGVQPRWRADGR